jgi:hypothetical protein
MRGSMNIKYPKDDGSILKNLIPVEMVDGKVKGPKPKSMGRPKIEIVEVLPSKCSNNLNEKEKWDRATNNTCISLDECDQFGFSVIKDAEGFILYYNGEAPKYKQLKDSAKNFMGIDKSQKTLRLLLYAYVLSIAEKDQEMDLCNKQLDANIALADQNLCKIKNAENSVMFNTLCVSVMLLIK